MKIIKLTLAAAAIGAAVITAAPAMAQVVGIGTTKGGANAAVGAAIAKVVSDSAGFQMRPQKMGGTQQYVPVINAGELEFGLSNVMQYGMAVDGTGMSEGKKHGNLRLVATLMQFRNGVIVAKNSGINSLADLKGKRVPAGYASSPLFEVFKNAFLASAGLSEADVTPVPVVGLRQSWDAFKEGKVDMTIAAAGAGPIKGMEAAIDGGIKFIPVIDNDTARAALPRTRFTVIDPAKPLVGVLEPTLLNVYEYVLFANASVSDDVVYKVAKAIYENNDALQATSPLWKTYKPQNIAIAFDGLDYHPGAAKFYKEQGLMK
jgi:TRAP transporter TAXI family solute receptor